MPTASEPVRIPIAAPAATPAADDSPVRVVEALYATISRPAGQAPDWERFRSLLAPGARFIPTNREADGRRTAYVQGADEYIAAWGDMLRERDFHEHQVAHRVERFGAVAHVWSTYESRNTPEDPEPFMRGINSIQLVHDGGGWRVLTVFWDSERPGNPIPPAYLPPADG